LPDDCRVPGSAGFGRCRDEVDMTTEQKKRIKHGGRKPLGAGEKSVNLVFRVTEAQKAKVARLGGAKWLRGVIDNAG